MILKLTPGFAGATTTTLVDDGATATGFDLLQGSSFGSPVWEHAFSGARGTQGARASQGRLPNREVILILRVSAATKDALAAKLANLATLVDDLRRGGGTLRWRSRSQTRYQNAEVLTASGELPTWDNRIEQINRAVVQVRLTCGPYMLWDPMDVLDDFSIDNVTAGDLNYTAKAGVIATDLAVSGGRLIGAGTLTTERTIIYTGNGYTYGDTEATVRFAPGATITAFGAGVVLKYVDNVNLLWVYIDDTGAVSRLRIDQTIAGALTNLASVNLGARIINGRHAWVRGRIEGNVVYAEHFLDTDYPNPVRTPTTSTSAVLSTAAAAAVGTAVEGKAGIYFVPQSSGAYIEDFAILPFTYRLPPTAVLDCYGAIPGDAPALGAIRAAPSISSNGAWGIVAWSPRPNPNLHQWGDFEDVFGSTGVNWTTAGVAGVTGAATSAITVGDTALGAGVKYGEAALQIITPATANTGAAYAMYRRFRRGVTYTATAWVRSNAGTTLVRIRLGINGDIASSTAVALSTTWTQHTATWTPTADVDLAYFAAEVTAATATTFQVDGIVVYQGAVAPSGGRRAEGAGGYPALTVHNAEALHDFTSVLARTVDANANGGFSMADSSVLAAGESYETRTFLDPGLIIPEDYTRDTVEVEVWARLMLSAAFTGGVKCILAASPENGAGISVYSTEFGATGRSLVMPSSGNSKWRMTRCGSLSLPVTRQGTRWLLIVQVVIAAGTNLQAFAFDDIFVIPKRARFLTPSGKTTTGNSAYAFFCNAGTGAWRQINSDLSSFLEAPVGAGPTGGITGSLVALPPGNLSVLALTSSMVPDNPDGSSASETQSFPSLHIAVTPRSAWLRDA